MKRKYIYGFILSIFLVSCEDFLSIEPQQSLPLSTSFGTAKDIRTALIGTYNRFQDPNIFGGDFVMVADLMTNNVVWQGSFTGPTEISQLDMETNNGNIDGMYADIYRLINNINGIIEVLPDLDDMDQGEKDQIMGEILYMRGAAYFEGVRYFGKPYGGTSSSDPGLPISSIFINGLDKVEDLPRSTVEEVYTQAINDLTTASGLLPDNNADGRANRFAALAYLAEIAFQQGRYTDAASFANQVITSGQFSLAGDVSSIYTNEFSDESILEVNHTVQDNPGVNAGMSTHYNPPSNAGRGDIVIAGDLITNGYNQIVTATQDAAVSGAGGTWEDTRRTLLTDGNVAFKYEDGTNNADNPFVHRLAELILMRAESLVRTGGLNQESVDLLNQIRARAIIVTGASQNLVLYNLADFASDTELIDAIVLERRVEMAFEGQRFHDLRRMGLPVKGIAATDPRLLFPIPQDAIDNNAALVQNEGY